MSDPPPSSSDFDLGSMYATPHSLFSSVKAFAWNEPEVPYQRHFCQSHSAVSFVDAQNSITVSMEYCLQLWFMFSVRYGGIVTQANEGISPTNAKDG